MIIEYIFWTMVGLFALAFWLAAGNETLVNYEKEHGSIYTYHTTGKWFAAIMIWPIYLIIGIVKTLKGS